MLQDLGKDIMDRFGPVRLPLDVKQCLMTNPANFEAYVQIDCHMERAQLETGLSQEQILRVAMYHKFDVNKSFRLLKHMDAKFWNISAKQLEAQLSTHTLFPLSKQLTSKDTTIKSFFYMKPSRFTPSETPTSGIIANLLYVMDSLDRFTDPNVSRNNHKIGFIANMNDWTMKHFTVDYCFQFMEALQGKMGPVNVDLFLIVNPPSWFDKVWQIMKPMLSSKFRAKVHMIHQDKLENYLASGYEQYLPQELANGQVDVAAHVKDFIQYRKYVEKRISPQERKPTKDTQRLVQLKIVGEASRRSSLEHKMPQQTTVQRGSRIKVLQRANQGRLHIPTKLDDPDMTISNISDEAENSDTA